MEPAGGVVKFVNAVIREFVKGAKKQGGKGAKEQGRTLSFSLVD
ncbi:hypothetical protein [Myroides guanonis]|uniref:Uncharacterized protein n=1 Tax=Myroides guanonis TaxID=1150112 RepID=A0A1I3PDI4_9FLAO|nr:hypothetical protein [Myroides guanonis]SFJ19481.1 hypothetical protein SAMN04487893_10477 [Myroides guanonis]